MYLDAHNLSIIVNLEERTCHTDRQRDYQVLPRHWDWSFVIRQGCHNQSRLRKEGLQLSNCNSMIRPSLILPAHTVRSPSNMPADTSSPLVSTSEWTEPGTDFYYVVKPNEMTYVDDTGVSRSIHIPRGKNEELYRLFENQNWKALSLSPAWSM
jgi:hypothetical protein